MSKQLLDQAAHLFAGYTVVLGAAVLGHPVVSGAWIGLCIGLAREYGEWQTAKQISDDYFAGLYNKPLSSIFTGGSLLDIFFWTAGGALGGAAWAWL